MKIRNISMFRPLKLCGCATEHRFCAYRIRCSHNTENQIFRYGTMRNVKVIFEIGFSGFSAFCRSIRIREKGTKTYKTGCVVHAYTSNNRMERNGQQQRGIVDGNVNEMKIFISAQKRVSHMSSHSQATISFCSVQKMCKLYRYSVSKSIDELLPIILHVIRQKNLHHFVWLLFNRFISKVSLIYIVICVFEQTSGLLSF